jgi:hypothetical protein
LSEAEKRHRQQPPWHGEGSRRIYEDNTQRLEAGVRAARELASWANEWVCESGDWKLPDTNVPDVNKAAQAFASALLNLTQDAAGSNAVNIRVTQGMNRVLVRGSYVAQNLPSQVGGIGASSWGEQRIHAIADARLTSTIAFTFSELTPWTPSGHERQAARVRAQSFSEAWWSWLCWSDKRGLPQWIGDVGRIAEDDPRHS